MNPKLHTRRGTRALALCGALLLLLTACLGDDSGGTGGDAAGGTEGGTAGGGGGGGQTVTIMSPWVETDEDRFLASLEAWESETGNTVSHEGSGDFETLIITRVQGGNPPDIAMVPQPGLADNLVGTGSVVALDDIVEGYQESVGDALYELGVIDDQLYGVLFLISVKSLIWHPLPDFADAGYEAPETWSEMLELTETIKADGNVDAPWCIGIESSGATGWVITDWFEDLMVATHGPEVYDQWVAHEIPFNAPEVQEVGEMFSELAFTDGNVLGGRSAIVTTPFGDALNPMFEDPPACMLGKQAQFITSFFPESVQEDVPANAGVFDFPRVEGGYDGDSLLISGDQALLLNSESEAARSLIQFMASPEGGAAWVEQGGRVSPHETFDAERYPDDLNRQIGDLVQQADAVVFDGSDAMPGAVGAGSFWTEMTAWVNGDVDLETALQNIEDSWPSE